VAAPVPRFIFTPGRIEHTGSRLGSDTRDVLAELGYEPGEIDRMSDEGVW
jgi:crotonobetainyl-CoA:carnitine CoA-transferase CaiB-like acyl-CoA transferase